jgi:hypothetical protein
VQGRSAYPSSLCAGTQIWNTGFSASLAPNVTLTDIFAPGNAYNLSATLLAGNGTVLNEFSRSVPPLDEGTVLIFMIQTAPWLVFLMPATTSLECVFTSSGARSTPNHLGFPR